jgi:hypothetical protein
LTRHRVIDVMSHDCRAVTYPVINIFCDAMLGRMRRGAFYATSPQCRDTLFVTLGDERLVWTSEDPGAPRLTYGPGGRENIHMSTRLTLKAVNEELARNGFNTTLAKGDGYFYFTSGEAADWLDSTVRVPTLSSLSLSDWIGEFRRLRDLNAQIGKASKQAK